MLLRPLRRDDVQRVAAIQNEESVSRWWGVADLTELQAKADGAADEAVTFAIDLDGELVGMVQYHEENTPDFRHAGIDVFVSSGVQGHGVGTDAVRTLARHLVHDRGHHRLVIDPAAANDAAIRSYAKIGFRPVGVMRRYWRAPDGTWQDGLLMDLLAEELT